MRSVLYVVTAGACGAGVGVISMFGVAVSCGAGVFVAPKAMNTGSVPKLYIWWKMGPMRREPRSVMIIEPWKGLASSSFCGMMPK